MRAIGSALELWMRLCGYPIRMVREFNKFHEPAIRRDSATYEAGFFQTGAIGRIEFVPVAVTFADYWFPLGGMNL